MAKRWSRSVGPWGCRVTVRELAGGWIQADIRAKGYPRKRERLGHRDRNLAIRWAKRVQADLQRGITDILESQPSLSRIIGLYRRYHSPKKGQGEQGNDQRCAKMWTALLGQDKPATAITTSEWEDFIVRRRSGAIDSHGQFVKTPKRQPVGSRTLERDLGWLVKVCSWAVRFRDETGRYLLTDNPLRGFEVPTEENPRRPIVTRDWVESVIKAAGLTPLRAMLVIADEHGRRVGSIRQLLVSDVLLQRTETWPHGAIRWRRETDKIKRDWVVPMSARLRTEIDRHRKTCRSLGDVPLFPSPTNTKMSVTKDRARRWLTAAVKTAKVGKVPGTLWHAIRRLWITEHKEMPLKERMYVAGYVDRQTMEMVYEHVDPLLLQETVEHRREYREAK